MSDIVLETKGLTKYFGSKPALDHLSFTVQRGCIYGLLGRNGAGKTTAIKLLLGLLQPTAGSAEVLGCDSQRLTPQVRQRVGYVTEGHRLYRWMRIKDLEGFQRAFFPKRWDAKLFDEMMDYFELSRRQKIKRLSNGQRAQVSLALALAPNPELLIMDDPTLGLDVAIRRQFLEGMIQLIQRQGRTIIFSSHILSDVERVVDRLGVIDRGVLRTDCSLDEFRRALRKVRFGFAEKIPDQIDLPGVLHERRDGRELELVLVGTTDEQIEDWTRRAGAAEHGEVGMNLEDQFIEFTEPNNGKRLFRSEVD